MERARTIFDDDPDFNKYFEAPRRRGGRARCEDGRRRGHGVQPQLRPPMVRPRVEAAGDRTTCSRALGRPSLDRAFQQVYIPGSTFKPFTALAAVKEGRGRSLDGSYGCPAEYVHAERRRRSTTFSNWSSVGSRGTVDHRAAADLVRHVLLQVGVGLLLPLCATTSSATTTSRSSEIFASGDSSVPTGLDLPGEAEGLIPDAAWGDDARAAEQEPGSCRTGGCPAATSC